MLFWAREADWQNGHEQTCRQNLWNLQLKQNRAVSVRFCGGTSSRLLEPLSLYSFNNSGTRGIRNEMTHILQSDNFASRTFWTSSTEWRIALYRLKQKSTCSWLRLLMFDNCMSRTHLYGTFSIHISNIRFETRCDPENLFTFFSCFPTSKQRVPKALRPTIIVSSLLQFISCSFHASTIIGHVRNIFVLRVFFVIPSNFLRYSNPHNECLR